MESDCPRPNLASARWLPFAMIALVPLLSLLVTAAQLAVLTPAFRGELLSMRSRWTPGRVALRRALVILQGATAAGLAFAAVASIHALITIERRGLGFETTHLLSARVSLPILGWIIRFVGRDSTTRLSKN